MTEKINVEVKTLLNRIHAILALVSWVIIGICVYNWMKDSWKYEDYSWLGFLVCGVIGVIRLFIINDKYAWQVATYEEIKALESMVESKLEKLSCNNISDAEVTSSESLVADEKKEDSLEELKSRINSFDDLLDLIDEPKIKEEAEHMRKFYGKEAYEHFLTVKAKQLGLKI
ncbi:hypothetical protein [Treponema sp. C6A8]|uniref:hypothetical protein n=1 Tax=Treponema sp. C6A8 TaxID=1410609 RepID=UPI000481F893|nr:hypothetical protein [Treponema sp. C6A8]